MFRYSCVSSSISNFHDKILRRYENTAPYKFPQHIYKPVIFWGMYHVGDYTRFLLHRGDRMVFWTGGDLLNLQKNSWQYGGLWRNLIKKAKSIHFVENDPERLILEQYGIKPIRIQPIILDDPGQFNVCYKPSNKPKVYVCCHPGYEEQYGVNLLEGIASVVPDVELHIYGIGGLSHDNIKYHGQVSNELFNKEIKGYQAFLRLNCMDGMSEGTFKSLLMGQWSITMHIAYPYVTFANSIQELIGALNDLKNKEKPNYAGREYWLRIAKQPLF